MSHKVPTIKHKQQRYRHTTRKQFSPFKRTQNGHKTRTKPRPNYSQRQPRELNYLKQIRQTTKQHNHMSKGQRLPYPKNPSFLTQTSRSKQRPKTNSQTIRHRSRLEGTVVTNARAAGLPITASISSLLKGCRNDAIQITLHQLTTLISAILNPSCRAHTRLFSSLT